MACLRVSLTVLLALLSAGATPVAADPKAWFQASQGTYALMRGEHAAAIAAYDQTLKSDDLADDLRANVFSNRGIANWRLGRLKDAIRDFNEAISLFSDYAEAYNNRGIVILQLGDPKLALLDFDRAVALVPGYGAAFYNRGNAYFALGDHEAALQAYGKAVRLMPTNAMAYRGRGMTQIALQRPFAAARDLSHAIALNPRYASSHRNRGDAYLAQKRYAAAIADYDTAIGHDPGDARAHVGRGRAYAAKRKYTLAVRDLNRAIEIDPKLADAHAARGGLRLSLGNLEGARADLSKALAVDPRHARALALRARIRLRRGLTKQALADADAALAVAPTLAEAVAVRGEIQGTRSAAAPAVAGLRHAGGSGAPPRGARADLKRLTGVVPVSAGPAGAVPPDSERWIVTRNAANHYVATHPDYPKIEARLEMYGPGQPRILDWSLLKKPFQGIGLLRYEAGTRAEPEATRLEYVAIVDLWRNQVMAIEPYSWGADKATWRWTQTAAVVTDPDGMVSTVKLRKPVPIAQPIARPSQPPAVGGYRARWNWRASRGATFFRENFGN